jgi:hypothetical protein
LKSLFSRAYFKLSENFLDELPLKRLKSIPTWANGNDAQKTLAVIVFS